MSKLLFKLLVGTGSLIFGLTQAVAEPTEGANKTIFDYTVKTITGDIVSLSIYKGKVLLVVNTASKCGFTSQLGDLQKLYEEYKDQGFEILGFPSNDFGGQEPLDNNGVQKFCASKYGVTFPLFEKGAVSGPDKQPVYKFLTESKGSTGEPGWNFVKFIVGKDGVVKDRFNSMTSPLSGAIKKRIEGLLKEP